MKKQFLMALALVAMSIISLSAQNAVILLQHNGTSKMYTSEQLNVAINAAVSGDTIYLNKGSFGDGSEIKITKPITIIGAGGDTGQTYINGNINVAINGTPTLTNTLLESLRLSSDVKISEPLSGLKLKRCSMNNFTQNALCYDVLLEQCYVRQYFYGTDSYLKSCVVINSKISYTCDYCEKTTFVNCNIRNTYSSSYPFKGTALNCIVMINKDGYVIQPANLTNCLCYNFFSNASYKDCYSTNGTNVLNSSTLECTQNKNTLLSNGYLGNDGTVVGIEGGTSPFTLDPSGPVVESSTIKVDVASQKLNVNLKVKAN